MIMVIMKCTQAGRSSRYITIYYSFVAKHTSWLKNRNFSVNIFVSNSFDFFQLLKGINYSIVVNFTSLDESLYEFKVYFIITLTIPITQNSRFLVMTFSQISIYKYFTSLRVMVSNIFVYIFFKKQDILTRVLKQPRRHIKKRIRLHDKR